MSKPEVPAVLAGPIVRHVSSEHCFLWIVTSAPVTGSVTLQQHAQTVDATTCIDYVPVGSRAFVGMIRIDYTSPVEADVPLHYDLQFDEPAFQSSWEDTKTGLCYPGTTSLSFCWQPHLQQVLHGSCRKPHHPGQDALTRVDSLLENAICNNKRRPDLLLMTGDQIYADDVAGPTLQAIQDVITALGLYGEPLEGAVINHSDELRSHPHNFYEREQLLPKISTNTALSKLFFGAKKKPVFTSVNAQNHLISFAEVMAMYLLVWSDAPWAFVTPNKEAVSGVHQDRFAHEQDNLKGFITCLPRVRRTLAHIPTYMIFDDHDVTDDWNLTRGWEQEVYGHPLSKRMIGNALIGYLLCQGWGNYPDKFKDIQPDIKKSFTAEGIRHHDAFIDMLLDFEDWDYQLNTTPSIHVMDTRTRRWRSESSLNKPSGLMDWEALCEFQQSLIGKQSVIVVSAAPIYGVKFIEAVQKVFTFFGKALTVDAENWMAHKGTANVMLNIFRHYKTPPEFIILSGDVHYSFVYDVRLRFQRNSPHITQFTCSGIKNCFPDTLITWLDRFNRWLYSPSSPLNVFTRRRNMSVRAREPEGHDGELLNAPAIGLLELDQNDTTVHCKALCASGETVEFPPHTPPKE
ncbi:alkaline phosphatase family protein [Alteromonas sp. H39]|uniref:alkaline phosphatase family protein n=1 Tax=Alteromonas sp. H39 TaxID=3389876 RepID=UPI0039E0C7A4